MSLAFRNAGPRAIAAGAALVALTAGCGARTGLLALGSDAGVADDAAPDGGCTCPRGQRCVDGTCVAASTGVILFGWTGVSVPSFPSSTWAWDGKSWKEQDVAGPSARDNPSMARLNDTCVMFGGTSYGLSTGFLGDTWIWDGSRWTERPVPGPTARDSAAMAALGSTVVLFGGVDFQGVLGDTWTFDGASWAKIDAPGPSARSGHAMAALNDTIVLFGGKNGDVTIAGGVPLGDTWTWNGTSWTQLHVQGPSARVGATMATLDGAVVLYGGMDASGNVLGDTWTWDGTTWTQRDVAGPRDPMHMTSLPNLATSFDGVVVLFAGFDLTGAPGATWTWDGTSWTQHEVPGPNVMEWQFQAAGMSAW